jgi:hypothetical protein
METPAFDFHDKQGGVQLSAEEVKGLLQTRRDFLEGRTTARPWEDIKRDLRRAKGSAPGKTCTGI